MSLTIQGLLAFAAAQLLEWSGTEFSDNEVVIWAVVSVKIVGAVMVYFGRLRHGDISWWGRKK